MINKYCGGYIPEYKGCVNEADSDLEKFTLEKINEYEDNMESFHMANALEAIWAIIGKTNKYIDETAPWALVKEEKTEELESVMVHLAENLRIIAILIKPAMEETSEKMLKQLGITNSEYDSIKEYGKNIEKVKVIEKGAPIFLRLDVEEEVQFIKDKMKA